MPVPVASTRQNGVHISEQANAVLPVSEGPFERAARLRKEAEASGAAANGGGAQPMDTQQQAQPSSVSQGQSQPAGKLQGELIAVNNLDFSYPGLGACACRCGCVVVACRSVHVHAFLTTSLTRKAVTAGDPLLPDPHHLLVH